MVAEYDVKILGKTFHAGETVPDLGSIKATKDGYEGLIADESKLDSLTWVENGAECLLTDGTQTKVKHFVGGAWVTL